MTEERRIVTGQLLKVHDPPVKLTLETRVPAKWLAVDCETGDIWWGNEGEWIRAPKAMIEALREWTEEQWAIDKKLAGRAMI